MSSLKTNAIFILVTTALLNKASCTRNYTLAEPTAEQQFQTFNDCRAGITGTFGGLDYRDHIDIAIQNLKRFENMNPYAEEYYESFLSFLYAADIPSIDDFCKPRRFPRTCKALVKKAFAGPSPFNYKTNDSLHSLITAVYYIRNEDINEKSQDVIEYFKKVREGAKISLSFIDCINGINEIFGDLNYAVHIDYAIQMLLRYRINNPYADEYYESFLPFLYAGDIASIDGFCEPRKFPRTCKALLKKAFVDPSPLIDFNTSDSLHSLIAAVYYVRNADVDDTTPKDVKDYFKTVREGAKFLLVKFDEQLGLSEFKIPYKFCADVSTRKIRIEVGENYNSRNGTE